MKQLRLTFMNPMMGAVGKTDLCVRIERREGKRKNEQW